MSRRLESWLYAYEAYSEGTESPSSFHLWCALGTIAAAAQRKIWLRHGRFQLHSNMFIVLVGPAGGPRKGTAMNMARNILSLSKDYGAKFELGPQKVSGASLISRMARINNAEHQSLTVYSMELGSLLGSASTDVTDVLTDLWDCNPDWNKETVSRGAESITKPWLNIVSATTPIWLADNLPKTAAEGGFVARIMPIYEEEKSRRIAIPHMTDEQMRLQADLAHDLAEISFLSGPMEFSPEGARYFTEWYEDASNFVPRFDNRMTTFYDRKHVHVLKAAIAISLARSDNLVVEPGDLGAAIQLVEDVERTMAFAFQGVGRNPLSLDYERVKKQLYDAQLQGLTYKSLLAKNIAAIDKVQLDMILSTLVQAGEAIIKDKLWYSARAVTIQRKEPP